jgi:hypothetical protein
MDDQAVILSEAKEPMLNLTSNPFATGDQLEWL